MPTLIAEQPKSIGPYRILASLGRGGMGVVYRAEHRDTGQIAAVKTVRLPREAILSSLRREILALARLRHPGIVRIVDEGVDDGLPWYAMELIEGITLDRWAAGAAVDADRTPETGEISTVSMADPWWTHSLADWRPLQPGHGTQVTPDFSASATPASVPSERILGSSSLEPALTLVRRLCSPLAFLHGEGLIHRDLKPENIIICFRQNSGESSASEWPVLVDFGLVAGHGGPSSREELGMTGVLVGTAAYIAPEQIRGQLVDARADLYSLGCILYELLTGRPPFVDGTTRGVLLQHLENTPDRPSRRNPAIPAQLDELILRLLSKNPRDRLGHADAVAAALEELGAGIGWRSDELPRSRAYLYRPGFAGRHEILDELAPSFARASEGAGALVLVGGESGVGKTRLALELSRVARGRGMQVLAAECSARPTGGTGVGQEQSAGGHAHLVGGAPLNSLRQPLQAIADRCRELGLAETERLLGPRGKLLALYESSLNGLPGQDAYRDPAELSLKAAQRRLFSYLTDTFAAFAGASPKGTDAASPTCRPLVLILDDLQWADELTLGWLEFLNMGERLQRTPMLLLGTYRTDEMNESLVRLSVSAKTVRLELGRLGMTSVAAIVGDMLALAPPPPVLSDFLSRQSEGNPFFLAEYLRAAVEIGLLWRDLDGQWQVAEASKQTASRDDYARLPLPHSLRELLERRLQDLAEPAATLMAAAAVLGRSAPAALLVRTAQLDETPFAEGAAELIRRHVLEEPEPGVLSFTHDKLREQAYGRLLLTQRRQLHRAAAEALEGSADSREPPPWAILGEHWQRAEERERAAAAYLAGAKAAKSRFAFADAEQLFRAYLSLVDRPTVESVNARVVLGDELLLPFGHAQEALAELERALEDARRAGARLEEGRVLRALGAWRIERGQFEEGDSLLDQAMAAQIEIGDREGECQTRISRGLSHLDQGLHADAHSAFEAALSLSREIGNRRCESMALNDLAIVHHSRGELADSRLRLNEVLRIAEELGNRQHQAVVMGNMSAILLDEGRLDDALDNYVRALEIAREIGDRRTETIQLSGIAVVRNRQGDFEEARRILEQTLELTKELGDRSYTETLAELAEIAEQQGRAEDAQRLYDEALHLARDSGDVRMLGMTQVSNARLLRLTGATDRAWALLQEAESLHRRRDDAANLAICLCQMGHCALARGTNARDHLAAAEAAATPFYLHDGCVPGQALTVLRRSVEAFEADDHARLFRGELIECVQAGLRSWLIESGNLDANQARDALATIERPRRATRSAGRGRRRRAR